MADIASGSELNVAPATGMEQEVLGAVPADASADTAALNARIAEAAASTMGANLNDLRFNVGGTASDTATGGVASDGASNGNDQGGDGGLADQGESQEPNANNPAASQQVTEATPKPGDQGAEQAPQVEAAPAVAKDYTLTIQGADTVDADGNKVAGKEYKVASIDELPEDFQPRHNRQVMEIIKSFDKLEQTKATDEAATAVQTQQAEAQAAQAEMLTSWDKEISVLQKAGQLEAPKLKSTDANYLADPAMKKVADIFAFMEKTNNDRKAAGNPNLIRSFADAFDKMELANLRTKQADDAKQEAETAKLKAGVVGGGQARGGASAAPVYVAGQAQDIRDLL